MARLALALFVVFLALGFGLRAFLQWRRTGDAGFRLGAFAGSGAEREGALLFAAALALGLAAPLLELSGALAAFEALRAPWLGALLWLVGMTGMLHAQLAMGSSWRVGVDPNERTTLKTDGPFRWVRNPVFSWVIVTATGLALLVPNAASLAGLAVLVASVQVQVRLVEEPYLRRTHGDAYERWASRTGRFVPGLGRL